VNRNAFEIYSKELRGVPFNLKLLVIVLPAGERWPPDIYDPVYAAGRREAQDIARKSYDNVAFTFVPEHPPGVLDVRGERGDPARIAPITPFTVLHRLWDSVGTGGGPSWREVIPEHFRRELPFSKLYDTMIAYDTQSYRLGGQLVRRGLAPDRVRAMAAVISAGVDTAAGRMGVLANSAQMNADLFALRAKTGKWGFNPDAPLVVNGVNVEWPPVLLALRHRSDAIMRAYIDALNIGLSRGNYVFYI
jgi:hypothetical protein